MSGVGPQEEEGSSLDSDIEEQEASADYVKGNDEKFEIEQTVDICSELA